MKKLRFYKGSHTYYFGSTKLDSVTTFIDRFFEEFDARAIARKLSKIPSNKAEKKGVRYFLNKWKESRDKGTLVHQQIEDMIIDREDGGDRLPQTISASVWIGGVLRDNPSFWLSPEVKIYDEDLRLAGTIDLVMTDLKTGKVSLVDWKTNDKITRTGYGGKKGILPPTKDMDDCHLSRYSLQLSLYAYMLERRGCLIDGLYLVHLQGQVAETIVVPYLRTKVEEMLIMDGRLVASDNNYLEG